jgi:V8-like Glu-specific endopeptidase
MREKKNFYIFLLISSLLISCGKKVDKNPLAVMDPSDRGERDDRVSDDESIRRFISEQNLTCKDEQECPDNIAKLVIIDRQRISFCTGTLISTDTILTTSSCLPRSLRVPGLNCQNNIFAIFPKTYSKPVQRIGCSKIISSDTNEFDDPALRRSDFAFVKLKDKVNRSSSFVSRRGLNVNSQYNAIKINYVDDYMGEMVKKKCNPLLNSFANPFTTSKYSPMVTVSDCGFLEGNVGAPVFNSKGFIVGLFSSKMDKKVGSFILNRNILNEPMADIHHVANTTCIKFPFTRYEIQRNKECTKDINISLLDQLRRKILVNSKIHLNNMMNIKAEIEKPVKYFKWKIKFFGNANSSTFEPHIEKPNCFFNLKSWIGEFYSRLGRLRTWVRKDIELPHYVLNTKLNRLLQPISVVTEQPNKKYSFYFNPRYASQMNNTSVVIGNTTLHGEPQENISYPDITSSCSNE